MIEDIPYQKILKEVLREGGEFADLFFEQTHSVVIICEEDRIEKVISGLDMGVGLRVLFGRKTFYGFTTEISKDSLFDLARRISRAAKEGGGEKGIDLPRSPRPALSSLPISKSLFPVQKPPERFSMEEKVSVLKRANEVARRIRSTCSAGEGSLSGFQSEAFHFEFRGALHRRGEGGDNSLCPGRFCERECCSNRI